MKLKKIMFATDFSEISDEALAYAVALARTEGARLDVVYVYEHMLTGTSFGGFAMEEQKELEEVEVSLKELTDKLPVPSTAHLLHGEPAEQLLKHAADSDADLIVIGTHGRRGVSRLLLGSVAETVVRRAECPVLTFKHPKHPVPAEPLTVSD